MNQDVEEYETPVELPDYLFHGELRAYNVFKCRCRYCVKYRRLYDSMTRYRTAARRKSGAREYLARKGIQLLPNGTFSRTPVKLAHVIAEHLGEDLPF